MNVLILGSLHHEFEAITWAIGELSTLKNARLCRVDVAEEALILLESRRFDLLILGQETITSKDSSAIVDRLREQASRLPTLLIGDDPDPAFDTALGAQARRLARPIERRALLSGLRDALEPAAPREGLRQASGGFLDSLLDNLPHIISVKDAESLRFVRFNTAAEDFFGYSRDEILGRRDGDIFPPDQARDFLEKDRQVLETGAMLSIPVEVVSTRLKGRRFLSTKKLPMLGDDGQTEFILGISSDITERLEIESDLAEKAEQLRQSQKMEAIGQLAGGIAHDFNNMLSIIIGYAELLLDAPEVKASDGALEQVKAIHEAALRSGSLTGQLLAFSRKSILVPDTFDLNDLVRESSALGRRILEEDIGLSLELGEGCPMVKVDRAGLQQVLLNLIVNARDACGAGGRIVLRTLPASFTADEASLLEVEKGRYACLEVVDNGCGMDSTTRNRIFEPFFTTKEVGKGTGLGLAMAYGFVKQSRGGVRVESNLGAGTSIQIYLPAHEREARPITPPRESAAPPSSSATILLVEDEPAVRDLARLALEANGYEVLDAPDGPAALSVAKERGADIALILSDVVMPQMTGCELTELLLQHIPGARILYMSGYADDALMQRGLRGAELDILRKPFSIQDLRRAVERALDGA